MKKIFSIPLTISLTFLLLMAALGALSSHHFAMGQGTTTVVGGAGGSPGGTNGQVQINNNGSFGAGPWTFNGATVTPSGAITFVMASNNFQINDSSGSADFLIQGSTGAITIARTGSPNSVFINGVWAPGASSLRIKFADQGQCTMAAGTCSAQTLGSTYATAPNVFVTWTGTGTCTGVLKASSTTTNATPSSSVGTDTCQVNWLALGN